MAVHAGLVDQRHHDRPDVCADRARLRADLQGDRRDQLRPGRVCHVRRLSRRRRGRDRRFSVLGIRIDRDRRHDSLGFGLERVVLRPMIGRPVIAVVMATIGLAAVLRGTATMAFGAGTRVIDMPVSDEPFQLGPVMLPPIQLVGAGVSLVFLAAFTWFFLKSRVGIAMRAVADSQQVSMAVGINVRRYFALAWAMAGVVSALGGVVWGAMLSVDNQLALVGLKVFPVVILGGLDSIIGAVIGGLIVGVVENLAAGYLDPYVGGGTKDFAPYVLMILVLMIRPEGIFGRRRIERV